MFESLSKHCLPFDQQFCRLNIRAITRGQVLNEDGTSLELHSTNFKTTVEFKAGTDGSQSGIETPKKRSRTTLFGRSMQVIVVQP